MLFHCNAENMSLSGAGQNSAAISVDQLIDSSSGVLKKASIQLEILGLCNQAHHLSVMTSRGGLRLEDQTTVVGGNFLNHVNYRAQVDWAGRTTVLNTDATAGKKSSVGPIDGPNRGPLNISLLIDSSNNNLTIPLLVGSYIDSLTVQIGLPF